MSRFNRGLTLAALVAAGCSRAPKPAGPVTPVPPAPEPAAAAAVVRIGVITSNAGAASNLTRYSASLLEGIRVAANEYPAHSTHKVELVIRDDGGTAARAAAAMTELQAAGVVAVIGPADAAAFNAAAAARTSQDLVMIAPALTNTSTAPNTYALSREDSAGAVLLAQYAATLKRKVGVIFQANGPFTDDAEAFANAYAAATGTQVVRATFPAGQTTFTNSILKMHDARVQVIYMPVSGTDIPQIVPQLGLHNMGSVQLLGGEPWLAEGTQKAVQRPLLEGVVAATVLPRPATDVAYQAFEKSYQQTYRKSLSNVIPGLGYDAARIILDAVPRGNFTRTDIARAVASPAPMHGATGVMSVRPGAVTRSAMLLRFQNGAWRPLPFPGSQ